MTNRAQLGGAQTPSPVTRRALIAAARRWGTPVYVTDAAAIAAAAESITRAFPDPWLRQYSVKANDVPGIISLVARAGFGANVVSQGEWAAARDAGVANLDITLEGIGKRDAELSAAVDAAAVGDPIRWLALESIDETKALIRIARNRLPSRKGAVDVLLRLNPQVAPETTAGLAVGNDQAKFGMTGPELRESLSLLAAASGPLQPRGLHLHIGSQLRGLTAWTVGLSSALRLFAELSPRVDRFDTLDVGGGFPASSADGSLPSADDFYRALHATLQATEPAARPSRLAIEPGRALVAKAGWLVGTVLHARDRGTPQVVIDAGMTDLIRPALYGAFHRVHALTALGRMRRDDQGRAVLSRVEGPICEATDTLGQHVLPPLARDDLVAIEDAGAYAASISSPYNGRPRPPQVVLTMDGELELIRPRSS
jgi:diaminopimelate decarboxylase